MPKVQASAKQPLQMAGRAPRRRLLEAESEGVTYRVGDSAYIILEAGEYNISSDAEPCEVCGKVNKRLGRKDVPLLECDKCLRGFHLSCLVPPLQGVPDDEWLCQDCISGKPIQAPRLRPTTAREKFMAGEWSLTLIEDIWEEPNGEIWFSGRWYYRPEETHTGRQEHHGAREVFLTNLIDSNDIQCLERVVAVCQPGDLGLYDGINDVCTCAYEYDATLKRFRRIMEESSDSGASEDTSSLESGSSEEDQDITYKPLKASRQLCNRLADRNMPGLAEKSSKRKWQGGAQWSLRKSVPVLGLPEVPRNRAEKTTSLCKAYSALSATIAPTSLLCREAEQSKICDFLTQAVAAGDANLGRCLFISGVPGTGKTATVLEAVRCLRQQADKKLIPPFQFIEINSLKLPSPQFAYTCLYEALTGQQYCPAAAITHLESMFAGNESGLKKRSRAIVLLDEMDLLVTRNQGVVYNLFDWPTKPGSQLAIIGIANTMDLPERLLPRIASRLGTSRIAFQPYNKSQLVTIVSHRLKEAGLLHTFADNAIQMACVKIAGFSGDVRRVFHLCRKAVEACEEESCSQVAVKHVAMAADTMFSAVHMQMLRRCCRLDKVLLASLLLQTRTTGRGDAALEELFGRMQHMLTANCKCDVRMGEVAAAARRLGSLQLVFLEHSWHRLHMQVSLTCPSDDVAHVLSTDTNLPWMTKFTF